MALMDWVPNEADRAARFSLMVEADQQDLIPNDQGFNCSMCMDDVTPGQGVILKECLHTFCRQAPALVYTLHIHTHTQAHTHTHSNTWPCTHSKTYI